ncbi:fatty acyl-CoA reductase wat-like isoform X2, partial [Vespula squamosa]
MTIVREHHHVRVYRAIWKAITNFGQEEDNWRADLEYSFMNMQSGNDEELTPIQKFYNDQNILITGGTGFMGKLLIERLLRTCLDITCIYLLIRPKKGKTALERAEELFRDSIFSKLREEQPKFENRIVTIESDCSVPNLDIRINDSVTLIQEVSIVFHVAATVRFNEKLKLATAINVRSLKDAINLSKKMSNLESFVYVCLAYSNYANNPIEEKFYEPPMDAYKLLDLMDSMDEKLIDDITPQLLGLWPNTYLYTKSVAENVVRKNAGMIPIGIFRPGMVISTYREPIRGWIDNMYGPIGMTVGAALGLIRSAYCDGSIKMELAPGDLTINGLIASAWDIANYQRSSEDIPIYNYVSKDNTITYDGLKVMSVKYALLIPAKEAIWYLSFRNTKYWPVHLFYMYFLHFLPALIIDTVAFCLGKRPRLMKLYNKFHELSYLSGNFTTVQWKFTNERWNELERKLTTKDRKLFFFDIKDVVWDTYFRTYILGIRTYLLKDPIETFPQARRKWQRFYWMHQGLKLVIAGIFFIIAWAIISLSKIIKKDAEEKIITIYSFANIRINHFFYLRSRLNRTVGRE